MYTHHRHIHTDTYSHTFYLSGSCRSQGTLGHGCPWYWPSTLQVCAECSVQLESTVCSVECVVVSTNICVCVYVCNVVWRYESFFLSLSLFFLSFLTPNPNPLPSPSPSLLHPSLSLSSSLFSVFSSHFSHIHTPFFLLQSFHPRQASPPRTGQ